jgi:hypothetical protein
MPVTLLREVVLILRASALVSMATDLTEALALLIIRWFWLSTVPL